MKKHNIVRLAFGLAVIAVMLLTAAGAIAQASANSSSLVGVWQVVRHGVDCNSGTELSTFPALMSFHKDGILSGQAVSPVTTNAYGPAEFGVWQGGLGHTFSFRDVSYGYTDAGAFNGSGIITATGQLTSATTFSYTATIDFYDVDGNLLFSICGEATATRFQ